MLLVMLRHSDTFIFYALFQAVSSDSDSNDPEGEKCAICLKKFRKQQIGNPSNCEHNFCVSCLEEWSKVTCQRRAPFLHQLGLCVRVHVA